VNATLQHPKDRWIARGVSLALHALLFAFFGKALLMAPPAATVIFSVETVSGITPLGEGSGAMGQAGQISDKPANLNPLAGGLRFNASDPPLPVPKAPAKPAKAAVKAVAAPPTQGDLAKRYEGLPIGMPTRGGRAGEELSEGGMGNARQAGAPGGAVGLQGAIAGRGYTPIDVSYGKALPEESEVVLLIRVNALGEVVEARVVKTSGFAELDQHASAKAREFRFDALPSGVPQVEVSGNMTFEFEYSGRGRLR
jgi:TonB family protein